MEKQLLEKLDEKFKYRKDLELARLHGVEYEYVSTNNRYGERYAVVFHRNCSVCNKNVNKKTYLPDDVVLCNYCKRIIANKRRAKDIDELLEVKTRSEIRFDNAVEEIKKQTKNFKAYKNAIKIAKTRCEKYGSIPEAMVAIELLKLKYSIIPQQKVGKYRVDFAIPKNKIVIEVDGKIFHSDKIKNVDRENKIQLMLGIEWKIIHVPAEWVKDNICLLGKYIEKAIETN